MKSIYYFFWFCCLIPLSAIANIHIEPYGGVGGAFSPSTTPAVFMKYTAGGRFGYKISFARAGLDLFWTYYDTKSSTDVTTVHPPNKDTKGFKQATPSLGIKVVPEPTSFQPLAIGAWTAVDLPLVFKAYGSLFYAFGKRDSIHHQGYGLKTGVSWLSAPFFQINLDIKWAYYFCQQDQCDSNFSMFSTFLSLSVPFSLDLFSADTSSEKSATTEPSLMEESTEEVPASAV